MSDQEALQETIKIAIQTQEDIKSQLLAEISQLESEVESQTPKPAARTNKFLQLSLKKAIEEKISLTEEIKRYKQNDLPQLQQKIDRINQKTETINQRIENLRQARNADLIEHISDPTKVHEAINKFSQSLTKEIEELSAIEADLEEKITVAKAELHALQERNLTKQRNEAINVWDNELHDEKKLNRAPIPVRRRSSTFSEKELPLKRQSLPLYREIM